MDAPPRIAALVLAAGEGRRMGCLKQLLPFAGRTVVECVADAAAAAGLAPVVVVLGCGAEEVRARLAGRRLLFAHNPDYTAGMLSSVQAGLRALLEAAGDVRGFLLCLGDQPEVAPATMALVAGALDEESIVVPVFGDRRGHPVGFGIRHAPAILALGAGESLRDVVRRSSEWVREVPVETPSVLNDLDTPEQYRQALARHAQP